MSIAAYPELFAVVGPQTPDLRGLFLRGVGGNSAGLGQTQGDAIRNIQGEAGFINDSDGVTDNGALYMNYKRLDRGHSAGGYGLIFTVTIDASRVVPTADENRPVNRAVRYLVRAKP